jgi:hypothetical protein
METKDINAELAHLNVVVKGIKTKANKQEILRQQAYINELPNKITKGYKLYKGCVYNLLKKSSNCVTFCCTCYMMNLFNINNKWTNYKACAKICKDNNLDPKTSMDHCLGTMSISIVTDIQTTCDAKRKE